MSTPYNPSELSQSAIVEFSKQCYNTLGSQYDMRSRFVDIDLAYMRETDMSTEQAKARAANKAGDPTKFQNIVMPVVMPQVESAVTYQQSVFLQGNPIFGVVGSPAIEDAALQMETIILNQQIRGNWVAEITRCLRNGFKYNLGAMEVEWKRETSYSLQTEVGYKAGQEGKPTELIWEGNKLSNLDMYNTFWDQRCLPTEISEWGEYAGYTKLMSRIRLKKFIESLPSKMNVTKAFESGFSATVAGAGTQGIPGYYLPQLNFGLFTDINKLTGTDWMAWAGLANGSLGAKINYKNLYEVTTVYGRILPSDFGFKGVPGPNIPQVWKFILVNNQVVIYAERLTNAHNLIPILFMQPMDDGLGYQTKAYAENVTPIQEITTALSNSTIAARRRAIGDRMLFDPSRISPGQLNNDNPVAKIPVRPSAFGTPISESVYAFPFRDDQFQVNGAEIQLYMGLANQISGLNPARQGQFVKGNKTKFEFSEIMNYANGRDQSTAMMLEGNFFTPLKEIIKVNILQYQGGISLFNPDSKTDVAIDPVALRKANLMFKISDGLIPSEKLIDGDSLTTALQAIGANAQLASGYNVTSAFSYLMKTRGADLRPFEKSPQQLAYEQAMASWQQSVSQIAEITYKANPNITPEDFKKSIPPQPLPEQYGYNPADQGKAKPTDTVSILQQVTNATSPAPTPQVTQNG